MTTEAKTELPPEGTLPSTEEPQDEGPTVASRIAEMEERIAEGKPILEEPDADEEPGSEEEALGDEPDTGEGDGDEDAEGEEAPGEGEEEPEGEGEEEEEGEGEEEVDEEEEEEEDELEDEELYVLKIPPRRPGEKAEEVEIEGLTEQQQQGVNRLLNGYMRGEDHRTQLAAVQKLRSQVETVARQMDVNPIGYISEALEQDTLVQLTRFLLTHEDIFEKVYPDAAEWETDESRRAGEHAIMERDILKTSHEAEKRRVADDAARDAGDAIIHHLEGMADNLNETQIGRFMRFSLSDLEDWVKQNPRTALDLETVNRVLSDTGVFESFGITPTLPNTKKNRRTPSKARSSRPASKRSNVEEAEKTSTRLKRTRAKKRKAATSAPPGSGAPPVSHPFKKGETVEERIAHIEKHGLPKV